MSEAKTSKTKTQASSLDPKATLDFVGKTWDASIVPKLVEYIAIPNKSPMFDPDWAAHGHMQKAVELIAAWCRARPIQGLKLEVVQLEKRTPVIYMEVPAFGCSSKDTVLLYGHLDKQPEMTGWREGLGPWKPVIEGDKLYGRGGADDGYAAFASLTAIEALQKANVPHVCCVVLIEACEESGSFDLPFYVDHLAPRIGTPSLVICLDSGCGNYEQLWGTTSLRGIAAGELSVEVLKEGVHSGDASGIVPSSFRILRHLLSRIEDPESGRLVDQFHVKVPKPRLDQARAAAEVLGDAVSSKFPWLPGMRPMHTDRTELVLNRTWRPTLSVTGVDGIPPLASAGNVLRPKTTVKLSVRVPPTLDAQAATGVLKKLLEADPPYGAKVTFHGEAGASGWEAPAMSPWLTESLANASNDYFGKPAVFMGEGGSIPFMGMLGARFPKAQFVITGLLGPGSNAHGPNEFLHIPTGKKLTACMARVLADHQQVR
jgi:acetylornithine deacetylase/succinyl-diaminopimelate desuccinylase-like protein